MDFINTPINLQNKAQFKEILDRAGSVYYNDPDSLDLVLTDEEFDIVKSKYEEYTGKRYTIGAKPNVSSTLAISHSYENLAGTLDKVNTIEEFFKWLNLKKIPATVELGISPKYDGHSILFETDKGRIKSALTRGENGLGKDLTGYFTKLFAKNDFIADITNKQPRGIAFEAVITEDNLKKLNKEFDKDYKSPRSAIGGIIKEDGLKYAKYLTMIPLKIHNIDNSISRSEQLNLLGYLEDLKVSGKMYPNIDAFEYVCGPASDIQMIYQTYIDTRLEFPYMLDGIVIEVLDDAIRERLGYTDNIPNFAIAFKFPHIVKATTVEDLYWSTEGNSATYTPMVLHAPVVINGMTYTNTPIANYAKFKRMKLRKGSRVKFERRNDVIGWLDRLEDPSNLKTPLYKAPTHCTFCKAPLKTDDTFLFCDNAECDLVQIGNLQQFIDKMGIKEIQRATTEALYRAGIVTSLADWVTIFSAETDIAHLEGFGESSARNIIQQVGKKLDGDVYDYELIGSLNIPLISNDRCKMIFKEIPLHELMTIFDSATEPDLELALAAFTSRMLDIPNIGDAIVDALLNGILLHEESIKQLVVMIKPKSLKDKLAATQVSGRKYKVVVTGDFKTYDRDEFKTAIELLGHKMVGSVSKNTDFLITNTPKSGTVKNMKAIELGVRIITEAEAITLLGLEQRNKVNVRSIEELF